RVIQAGQADGQHRLHALLAEGNGPRVRDQGARGDRVAGPLEVKQSLCIATPNFFTVRIADRRVIQPVCRDRRVFEWKIHGVEDAIGANFSHDFRQCRCSEIAARRDVKVLSQIVTDGTLGAWLGSQGSGYAVIDTPDVAGESFSQMAENNLEPRIVIE